MKSNDTVSLAILRLLVAQGFSYTHVASVVDISKSEMTRVGKGEREFKVSHLVRIAEHLQIPLCALLAKAMQFFDGRAQASERLASLIIEVTREVEIVLEERRRKPGDLVAEVGITKVA
jgi:hypothetical protein